MNEWKKIYFNANNVLQQTPKAYQIMMPRKGKYRGYWFWVSKKLVRDEGGRGYHLSLLYKDDFEFVLYSSGSGKYSSRQIVDEVTINGQELEEEFGTVSKAVGQFVNEETKKIIREGEVEVIITRHVPEPIDPVEPTLHPDLKK